MIEQIARSYLEPEPQLEVDEPTECVMPESTSYTASRPVYPEDHGEKLAQLLEQNSAMMRRNMMVRPAYRR